MSVGGDPDSTIQLVGAAALFLLLVTLIIVDVLRGETVRAKAEPVAFWTKINAVGTLLLFAGAIGTIVIGGYTLSSIGAQLTAAQEQADAATAANRPWLRNRRCWCNNPGGPQGSGKRKPVGHC